jgi:hypothetical protein
MAAGQRVSVSGEVESVIADTIVPSKSTTTGLASAWNCGEPGYDSEANVRLTCTGWQLREWPPGGAPSLPVRL